MQKTVTSTLLDRRSIRRYERESISPETIQFIHDAIRNTPTSYNGQQYSVIDIADQNLKEKIYGITEEKQIKTCNHFFVFCADYYKIKQGAMKKGIEMPDFPQTVDGYTVGVIDATLAMMSALTAAESCGLGTCCVGYTRTAAPKELSEVLKLPEGVAIVCGLTVGIPRELPDMKPKQPESLLIHSDYYRTDDMTDDIMCYDKTISDYNMTREGAKTDNDWVGHIIDFYREASDYDMLRAMQERGFLIMNK